MKTFLMRNDIFLMLTACITVFIREISVIIFRIKNIILAVKGNLHPAMGSVGLWGIDCGALLSPIDALVTVDDTTVDLCVKAHKPGKLVKESREAIAVAPFFAQHAQGFLLGPALGATLIDCPGAVIKAFHHIFIDNAQHLFTGHFRGVNQLRQNIPELLIKLRNTCCDLTVSIEMEPSQIRVGGRVSILVDIMQAYAREEKAGLVV